MMTHHPPMLALNDGAPLNAKFRVVTPDTSLEGERGRGVRAVRSSCVAVLHPKLQRNKLASPVGQIARKRLLRSGCGALRNPRIAAEKIRHVCDGPRIPPLDVAVRGLGGRCIVHPCVHGGADVGVSDGRETWGAKRVALVVFIERSARSNHTARPNTCGGRDHEVSAVGGARDLARGGGHDPAVRAEVEHGDARRIDKDTAVRQPVRCGPGIASVTCVGEIIK